MNKKNYEQWKETREKGRTKFIIQNGVLTYGVAMFVVMTFIVNRNSDPHTAISILINLLIWLSAGFFFGLILWTVQEKSFKKDSEKNDDT